MMNCIKWSALIGGCIAMISCTTMEPLPSDKGHLQRDLHSGDTVEVNKVDGRRLHFDVERVDKDGLYGPGITVPFNEIRSINREETSWWRTGLIALGAVAGGVLIAMASSGKKSGGGGGW
jgi:hypothetical protein